MIPVRLSLFCEEKSVQLHLGERKGAVGSLAMLPASAGVDASIVAVRFGDDWVPNLLVFVPKSSPPSKVS